MLMGSFTFLSYWPLEYYEVMCSWQNCMSMLIIDNQSNANECFFMVIKHNNKSLPWYLRMNEMKRLDV